MDFIKLFETNGNFCLLRAHPEFGQILATCSFDRTAAIWEEIGIYLKF